MNESHFQPLETERLILREWSLDDAPALYALNSDPEVLRYTADEPFKELDSTRQFIDAYDHYKVHGHGRWAVIDKITQEFIGWCGFRRLDNELIDLGYRFCNLPQK